jgi:hypothetical protein
MTGHTKKGEKGQRTPKGIRKEGTNGRRKEGSEERKGRLEEERTDGRD